MPLDAPHKCPECGEAFVRFSGLRGHLERSHGYDKSPADSGARYALWNAFVQHRFNITLRHEDIEVLDQLAQIAAGLDARTLHPGLGTGTPEPPERSVPRTIAPVEGSGP